MSIAWTGVCAQFNFSLKTCALSDLDILVLIRTTEKARLELNKHDGQCSYQVLAQFNISNALISNFPDFLGRVLLVFKVGCACQAWGGLSPTRERWLGRFWMKRTMLTAFALCSSTGLLYDSLKHCLGFKELGLDQTPFCWCDTEISQIVSTLFNITGDLGLFFSFFWLAYHLLFCFVLDLCFWLL